MPFSKMECIFVLVMNQGLISIGSNENREANLILCRDLLSNNFAGIRFSDISVTSPYGSIYKNDFINQLAVIITDKERLEVCQLLKSIEREMGRTPDDKKNGAVKIDIDLAVWNGEIIKPEDMARSYISDLLPSLNI